MCYSYLTGKRLALLNCLIGFLSTTITLCNNIPEKKQPKVNICVSNTLRQLFPSVWSTHMSIKGTLIHFRWRKTIKPSWLVVRKVLIRVKWIYRKLWEATLVQQYTRYLLISSHDYFIQTEERFDITLRFITIKLKMWFLARKVELNHSAAKQLQVWSLHPGPPRLIRAISTTHARVIYTTAQ